jgi:universal stress protein A
LSDRQLVHGSNLLCWTLASGLPPGLDQQDPELTGNKRCTDQHEKCDELTSRTGTGPPANRGENPAARSSTQDFFSYTKFSAL